MLEYRQIDYNKDVPEIIQLLRTSLSENHSIQSFLWKHKENPFGESYGLLACDEEKIVGVRMFMFWEFKRGNELVKAIRPVDTITHPDYRGKGVFKKLTFKGLEDCQNNFELVFNTPNINSLPGYLKMGWKKYTKKLDFMIAFVPPVSLKKLNYKHISITDLSIGEIKNTSEFFCTGLSNAYLHWRYKNPDYKVAFFESKGRKTYVLYRIKKIRGFKTMIIMEIVGDKSLSSSAVRTLCSALKTWLVYYLNNYSTELKFHLKKKRQDSTVVYRDDKLNTIDKILFSAGDLEGKL